MAFVVFVSVALWGRQLVPLIVQNNAVAHFLGAALEWKTAWF
ncbi:hypothetical protein [Acetobacter orientalis]